MVATTRMIRSIAAGAAVTLAAAGAIATDLSNNLSNASAGTETASGTKWLAASFGTGPAPHVLDAVTLSLANPVPGDARVMIYSAGGLEPGDLLATLTSPNDYSATLAPTTFTTSGILLSASSTYWVVLEAVSGEFRWSWTIDASASGVGYQGVWGVSEDAGGFWWNHDIYALQMGVLADACNAPSIVDAPDDDAVCRAGTATFTVTGAGTGPLSYRWRRAGADLSDGTTGYGSVISGATTATLTITNAGVSDAGLYSVRVSNACGWIESANASLTVCGADANCDGFVNGDDYDAFVVMFEAGEPAADFNGDGFVNGDDFDAYVVAFEAGC